MAALQQPFILPGDFRLPDHFSGAFGVIQEGKPQRIVIEFSGWAAVNVREIQWHPSQRILRDGDGKITAHFEITSTHQFKRWILGYGRFARVLGIAGSKTLSKLANHCAKRSPLDGHPEGVCVLVQPETIDEALGRVELGDLWGINCGSIRRLARLGITTPDIINKRVIFVAMAYIYDLQI